MTQEPDRDKNSRYFRIPRYQFGVGLGIIVAIASFAWWQGYLMSRIENIREINGYELTKAKDKLTKDVAEYTSTSITRVRSALNEIESFIPVGTVFVYYGEIDEASGFGPPRGWLECNGTPLSKLDPDEHHRLIDHLTRMKRTSLPDLRGQFLRGLDAGAGIDTENNRVIGSLQTDALQQHYHMIKYTGTEHMGPQRGPLHGDLADREKAGGFSDQHPWSITGAVVVPEWLIWGGVDYGARTSPETRPKNVAVNFIIKY